MAQARSRTWVYVITIIAIAAATFAVMLLMQNIALRKEEGKQVVFQVANIDETVVNPAEWGKNFPRQYDSYLRTVDTVRTRHGGSDAFQKLDVDPRWRELFKGYAFGVDYREERGHAYMLADQDMTERVKDFKQPGACLHCHSAIIPAYRAKGKEAGVPDSDSLGQIMKGFEIVCAMDYKDARTLVEHPVTCQDCHAPQSMALRVTRPGFLNGIQRLAESGQSLPHLPSIERWQKGDRSKPYDPNVDASRQEMRSFVCGQCHVEYYFKGTGKMLTYPWHDGINMEQIETYYDSVGHKDWTHATSGAPVLKAQHPEFEMWNQGIHARSGVACADCHMPYYREGAVKISDHHIRSPLLNIARACQNCHRSPEDEILARAQRIQDKTSDLMIRAEEAVIDLIKAIEVAKINGADSLSLTKPRDFHRKAQWRLDFVAAENSMGFHAPQDATRILGEAIDYARQGYMELVRNKAVLTAEAR
ncbi:MAG: ammonia-forming cytochrome c nitrite reductase subunit c552 [bacterium]|nr:ammonia-forming cytochrome c nitrite reductase subunit c552 [bacterium]